MSNLCPAFDKNPVPKLYNGKTIQREIGTFSYMPRVLEKFYTHKFDISYIRIRASP